LADSENEEEVPPPEYVGTHEYDVVADILNKDEYKGSGNSSYFSPYDLFLYKVHLLKENSVQAWNGKYYPFIQEKIDKVDSFINKHPDLYRSGIYGMVYNDTISNGERDLGELGVPGTKVTLSTENREEIESITTGEGGSYLFTGLPPERYVITEKDPSGMASSTLNTITVILHNNGGLATLNFGDYKK